MKIDLPFCGGFVRAFIALALIFARFAFTNSPAAHGTTLMRMSVAQMSRTAQVIIRGRCLTNETTWDAGEIWTSTTFKLKKCGVAHLYRWWPPLEASGCAFSAAHSVTSPPASPAFLASSQGEEVVLFLERTRRGDFSIVSWQQGTFRVRRDRQTGEEVVTQDTSSFATYDPVHRHFEEDGIRSMRTADLRSHVDAALQRKP